MNAPRLTRRDLLKRTAVAFTLAAAPALAAAAKPRAPGFKIGGVDWELTKPADPEALAVAARLSFDGLQVDLGDVVSFDEAKQKAHRARAKSLGIEIASLALGALSNAPYAHDPKGQVLVEKAIEVTRVMKQRLLLLAFFGDNDIKKNQDDALVQRLKEIAPQAEKAGVILCVEAETSAEHYRTIIDRVGSPAVKVYFDCVHAHVNGGDIFEEIKLLGDRICEFHAKDYGHILLGQGKIDFKQVRRGMDAIGYRGWIQVEQWGEINGDKPLGFDETHRRNLRFLRELFPASA